MAVELAELVFCEEEALLKKLHYNNKKQPKSFRLLTSALSVSSLRSWWGKLELKFFHHS